MTIIQIKSTSNIEPKKIKALRKLFTSTSLSTALLSFISTMGGLRLYIFQDNFLSAFLLSGAVQGALFGMSTEFFKILNKYPRKISKIAVIAIWLFLLIFSSGFSYVGISKTAYSDDVLEEDAEQVLIMYCLDTDYELIDYIKKLEKKYLVDFYNYLDKLNGGKENFTVSEQDQKILESQKTALETYQSTTEIDKGNGTKVSTSEISGILNTEMLCVYIDTIKEGNYGNDQALNNKIADASKKKSEYDQRYSEENKLITGDPEVGNEGYNARSYQFGDLSHPIYRAIQDNITIAQENMLKIKAFSDKLDDFVKYLEECKMYIENDFETSAENSIYQQTLLLKEEINKENINTEVVISISEEIYDKLIENNISVEDEKITGYAIFKNNVNEYKNVVEQKQDLEKEIEELNDYSSELLLGITVDSTDDSINQNDNPSDSIDNSVISTDKTDSSDKAWKIAWSNHLLKIQSVIKELPSETVDNDNSISLPKEKTTYLEEISDRKRLYLTDINDFDRAWTLFFTNFHPIKYKSMLFVSVIIAFGLDLISFAMGCLLSKIKV